MEFNIRAGVEALDISPALTPLISPSRSAERTRRYLTRLLFGMIAVDFDTTLEVEFGVLEVGVSNW